MRLVQHNAGIRDLIVHEILSIIFDAQVCKYRRREGAIDTMLFFLQIIGITTGLNCGVQLASIYLSEMDLVVSEALHANMYAYKRFVDDILIITDAATEQILDYFQRFGDGLTITHETDEDSLHTHFLDLMIDIRDASLSWSTYRKPMNMYDYVPGNSSHSAHTKQALVKTELVRLLKTNSCEDAYEYNRDFFLGKLNKRGHDVLATRCVAHTYPYCAKQSILEKCSKKVSDQNLVPFKLVFPAALKI